MDFNFDDDKINNKLDTFLSQAMSNLDLTAPYTVGRIYVKTLQTMMQSWIDQTSIDLEGFQLGLASLLSMNRVFRSIDCRPILPGIDDDSDSDDEEIMDPFQENESLDSNNNRKKFSNKEMKIRRNHIPLNLDEEFCFLAKKFPHFIVKFLKKMTGIEEMIENLHSQGKYEYWLITSIGTKWQLDSLNNIIVHQDRFFKDVVKYARPHIPGFGFM